MVSVLLQSCGHEPCTERCGEMGYLKYDFAPYQLWDIEKKFPPLPLLLLVLLTFTALPFSAKQSRAIHE